MPFNRTAIQTAAAQLAWRGVYIGTSSWKYDGWFDQLYSPERYEYRGKVAKTRFERECLREYAEVFKTVCVDAAYYTFPTLFLIVSPGFQEGNERGYRHGTWTGISGERWYHFPSGADTSIVGNQWVAENIYS